jgi:hypothetical protein
MVHVVVQAASPPAAVSQLQDWLNQLSVLVGPYVVLIGAVIANLVQSLLQKFPWLSSDIAKVQDLKRKLLAIALPLVGTFVAGLATGQNTLHLAPYIFVVGQILYAAVKALQAAGASVLADVPLASEQPPQG